MPQEEDEQDVNLSNDAEDGDDTAEDEGNTDTSADDDKGGDIDEGSGAADENVDDVTDPDELKDKLKKSDDANKKLFARLQDSKGLKLDKKTGKWVPKESNRTAPTNKKQNKSGADNLTPSDLYALMDAKVPKEDIEEVSDYAKLKGISIADALERPFLKSLLTERAEERTTSQATNTGPSKGGSSKPSVNENIKKAESKGELPENQSDIEDIVEQRLNRRIGNK